VTTAIYEIRPDIATADDLRSSPDIMASALQSYLNTTSGPLTEIPSSVCYLPFSSVMQTPILEHIALPIPSPSIENRYSLLRQKILASRFEPGTRLGQIEFNFDRSNYSPYFTAVPGKKYATMMQMLQYPFSVGSIHIPEASRFDEVPITMHDKPIINPRYYQDEGGNVDFLTMVESQTFAHKITKTPPLSSIIIKRVFPPLPEEGKGEDFADFVRNYTVTDWHPVGTCAMGPEPGKKGSEFGGVVDARLRVYGVKGLRVVDASIMPTHISAHIQATVYAIAEKGASMILEDYH
jgi:choline dehydrogenase-like flavoprotein